MNMHKVRFTAALLGALVLAAACSPPGKQAEINAPPPTCVAVLPTEAANQSLTEGAAVLDDVLRETLGASGKARFLGANQAAPLLQAPEDTLRLNAAREVAGSAGCNAVLETRISRFVEREGGRYGVQQPAAVTLGYRLYSVENGAVLCHGRFDERQQSLMENLFSLGKAGHRGLAWLTAGELAREGLQAQLQECPYLK